MAPIKIVRNPAGKNQHPSIDKEKLRKALYQYIVVENVTPLTDVVLRLKHEMGIAIGLRTLTRYKAKFNMPSARKANLSKEDVQDAVINWIETHDPECMSSANVVKQAMALDNGPRIKRDVVREVMRDRYPEFFRMRAPTWRSKRIHNSIVRSYGPNDQLSVDGHDKLLCCGFPIYGMKDKYSRRWMSLRIAPSNRRLVTVRLLYLELVKELGGIPLQVTSDRGSETGDIYASQQLLRTLIQEGTDTLCERIGISALPEPHKFLPSIRNITVERGWKPLVTKFNKKFQRSVDNATRAGDYVPDNEDHQILYSYIFAPLAQRELSLYQTITNRTRVKKQQGMALPSGKSPNTMFYSAAAEGGVDCLLKLTPRGMAVVDRWIEQIQVDHPRLMSFMTEKQERWAASIYQLVSEGAEAQGTPIPPIERVTLRNAWPIFRLMAEHRDLVQREAEVIM